MSDRSRQAVVGTLGFFALVFWAFALPRMAFARAICFALAPLEDPAFAFAAATFTAGFAPALALAALAPAFGFAAEVFPVIALPPVEALEAAAGLRVLAAFAGAAAASDAFAASAPIASTSAALTCDRLLKTRGGCAAVEDLAL